MTWRTEAYVRLGTRLDRIVGGPTAKQFEALRVRTVADLLNHLPRRYLSGAELSDLAALRPDEEVAVLAEIRTAKTFNMAGDGPPWRRSGHQKPRLEAVITDHRGTLTLAFFGQPRLIAYWKEMLEPGARGIFAGKVKEFNGKLQLAHPDFVIFSSDGTLVGAQRNQVLAQVSQSTMIGIYPSTNKLRTWNIAQSVALALQHVEGVNDPLPEDVRRAADVVDLGTAYRGVHQPQTRSEVSRAEARLRFDEAFGLQLTMAYRRADAAAHGATPRSPRRGGLLDAFDARLPFTLTEGQLQVTETIMTELARNRPMQRLLQGEVGSGKTLVALRAMLAVVDAGGQAAFLAPTEVLAAQHLQTITRLLGDLVGGGLLSTHAEATGVVLVTGSLTAAQRREATLRAASGEAGIVIGTHALLSQDVHFADLSLVVVDEQHRFGVEQRAALTAKARTRPHVLVMTATPIPRSVAMTVFGDLEVSTLRELPTGRAEVGTVTVDIRRHPGWVDRAWARIREEVAAGRQAYVVCARISTPDTDKPGRKGGAPAELDEVTVEGDEVAPAMAVEELFAELSHGPLSELRVDMLHGQLPVEDKDAVMSRFAAGETDVLVATTVIEVGVDVPNASVMVIYDADRFGISQLHQLRGRIGRGGHPGVCLLLTQAPEGTPARDRLAVVAATRDGFVLAEADLEQRREGDVLGASQSGLRSSLRLLRVLTDSDLIATARTIAEGCVAADPQRSDPGLADIVAAVEQQAAGEWLERT